MNQHYVPQSYLNKFSEPNKKKSIISVYDKIEKRYFKTGSKAICSEINLYTLDEHNKLSKDILGIEKLYANEIEPLYLKSYELLTNPQVFDISDIQRCEIIFSILQLHLRNPEYLRRAIQNYTREIRDSFNYARRLGKKGITYLNEDFSFKEFSLDSIITHFTDKLRKDFKENHLWGVINSGEFHEFAKFEVAHGDKESYFMTGDVPLIVEEVISNTNDLFTKTTEFKISLNRRTMLRIFHDKNVKLNTIKRYQCLNGTSYSFNKAILSQSNRFVLSDEALMKEHSSMENSLNNLSIENKIEALKNLISFDSDKTENKDATKVIKHYIDIYEREGKLSHQEESEMYRSLNILAKKYIKSRI